MQRKSLSNLNTAGAVTCIKNPPVELKKMKFLLVLASFVLIASSRPADKKGEIKQDQETKDQIPPYLLELYDNLSKGDRESINSLSGANEVFSLKNVAPVPQCNIFNFSLADIDSNHERIVKSQLHLYMEREATNSLFYVSIRELQTFEEAEVSEYLKVRPSQGSGWVVFDVHKEVIALIQSGESHAVFEVLIYQNLSDVDGEEGYLDCSESPISFVSSTSDPDEAPFLTVHSYDLALDKIDYNSVKKSATQKSRERWSRDISVEQDCSPSCQVHNLQLSTSNIPLDEGHTILLPISYDARICGGSCELIHPDGRILHNSLLHYWITSQKSTPPSSCSNAVFQRYCTPSEYSSLVVLVQTNYSYRLVTIRNLRIARCDCVEVVEFQKLDDGSGDIVY